MKKEEVKARLREVGIFPGIRVPSADSALYAAETLYAAGIPVAEITTTVPGCVDVISKLAHRFPDMAVGAGTVLDSETAQRCLDAGARFITSTGIVAEVIETTLRANVVSIPGALTPSEAISCWKSGADFVKIFPVAALGGDLYVRSLRLPLPQIDLIATGGVNPGNASAFIRAGSTAIGLSAELLPRDAVLKKQGHRIHELARRFLALVKDGRSDL
jgi:2-dehydro-3-deoxyphosphogluconate aldolase/(4S)-4-hydroxy-2-oxoglutarate aldolase